MGHDLFLSLLLLFFSPSSFSSLTSIFSSSFLLSSPSFLIIFLPSFLPSLSPPRLHLRTIMHTRTSCPSHLGIKASELHWHASLHMVQDGRKEVIRRQPSYVVVLPAWLVNSSLAANFAQHSEGLGVCWYAHFVQLLSWGQLYFSFSTLEEHARDFCPILLPWMPVSVKHGTNGLNNHNAFSGPLIGWVIVDKWWCCPLHIRCSLIKAATTMGHSWVEKGWNCYWPPWTSLMSPQAFPTPGHCGNHNLWLPFTQVIHLSLLEDFLLRRLYYTLLE